MKSTTLMLAAACVLAHTSAVALQLTQVHVDRNVFDPARKEKADVKFHLDEPAGAELLLFDGRDVLVRTVRATAVLQPGDRAITWDGKDESGRVVPREAYHFVVKATSPGGATAVSDLSDATGGEQIVAQNVAWDADAHRIRYRLPQAARVNIRVGLQDNGPVLRTVIDWVARPAGDNEQAWDGWDESHVLDVGKHPKLSVFVDAYALSTNTLLVGPVTDAVALIDPLPWGRHEREGRTAPRKLMHYHSQQPIEQRGDVAVRVVLPEGLSKNAAGVPEVSGRVTVRLDVDPKDRDRVIRTRFEPVFFVDGTFAFENEVGYLPFSWIWDTSTMNEGIHYVSVNVRGYEGNFGMATVKVDVRHAPTGKGAEQ